MQDAPDSATELSQPVKSKGVVDFDSARKAIRGAFMAEPGKPFTLRTEICTHVSKAIEKNSDHGGSVAGGAKHGNVDGKEID